MNLEKQESRFELIRQIHSTTNLKRKQYALKQFEVQNGRIFQYVKEDLLKQYDHTSVRETPIVSTINVQRKITKKKATVYNYDIKRTFQDLDEDQSSVAELIYRDMKANMKFGQMNKAFVYQEQSIGMIVPKDGKLICRTFKMHQIDGIPSIDDPETAEGFIISAMDRYNYLETDSFMKDSATGFHANSERSSAMYSSNSQIADEYDYKRYINKFLVWTREYNFIMDGHGNIIDPETGEIDNSLDIRSPLAEYNIIPFFEVASEKDYELFCRPSNSLTDFTVQFNSRLSDESNVIKMNGYSVAILKAPSDMQPVDQTIGPAMILKLNTDDPTKEVDFQFASPQSNIGEISAANDTLLNYFITTEDIDGEEINSSGQTRKYTSGLDRFIAITDRMSANKDTYEAFRCMERDVWNVIKHWLLVLNNTDLLDNKYKIPNINMESEVFVKYGHPEFIQSEDERVTLYQKKIDLGIMSKIEAIMKDRDVTREQAEEIAMQIDKDDMGEMTTLEE